MELAWVKGVLITKRKAIKLEEIMKENSILDISLDIIY